MKYCENVNCEFDEPVERVSDYRIVEDDSGTSVVICQFCHELEREVQYPRGNTLITITRYN